MLEAFPLLSPKFSSVITSLNNDANYPCILRVMKMNFWNLRLQNKTENETMEGSGGPLNIPTSQHIAGVVLSKYPILPCHRLRKD